jgi:hypothetical protein
MRPEVQRQRRERQPFQVLLVLTTEIQTMSNCRKARCYPDPKALAPKEAGYCDIAANRVILKCALEAFANAAISALCTSIVGVLRIAPQASFRSGGEVGTYVYIYALQSSVSIPMAKILTVLLLLLGPKSTTSGPYCTYGRHLQ